MPFPFQAILIAGAAGFVLTAILFLLVRKMPRTEAGAGWWATSSLSAGLGYVALLAFGLNGDPATGEAVYNMFFIGWVSALYIGGRRFLGLSTRKRIVIPLAGAIGAWLAVFYFVTPAFLPAAIGVALYCGALNLHLGWLWGRHWEHRTALHVLLIGALWISGAHWLDYPLLRPVEWFAPIGFTLCAVISVVVNGTLAAILLKQFRRRMEDAEQQAMVLARHDALTGLANRVALDVHFESAVANAHRHSSQFAMLFIDLDGFKAVNDTHGHKVGDAILVEIANRLKGALREADVVARIGGDEFVVLLTEVNPHFRSAVETTTEKLLQVIGAPTTIDAVAVSVRASIGLAYFPDHGETLNHLMLASDKAMYAAKTGGRNAYRLAG